MSALQATQIRPATAHYRRPYLCLLDHDGNLRGARRAEGFDLPDMIRKTYDVLPHPDMPDAIYTRMSQRLEEKPGSAGYYMCKTSDGSIFWISVSIYRTHKGLVVCHMPIKSPIFDKFAKLNAHLNEAEQEGLDPEEVAARLVTLMLADGVSDYRTLATSIMIEEIGKRDAGRNRKQYRDLLALRSILETLKDIDASGKKIGDLSNRSRLMPYQLKLQAVRLEGRQGPLSVIADNNRQLTDTLLAVTADLCTASSTELDAVVDSIAYVAQSNHAAELLEAGCQPQGSSPVDEAAIRAELEEVIEACTQQISILRAKIDQSLLALAAVCQRMRRAISAIEMTTMMCKIERGRLNIEAQGLRGIEQQLRVLQNALSDWMGKIDTGAATALSLAETLKQPCSAKIYATRAVP